MTFSDQVLERFVGGDFLCIGVADAIALPGGFRLVENFELDEFPDGGCGRFRKHPGGVEMLNGPQTWND
jgi:hypothetical protein